MNLRKAIVLKFTAAFTVFLMSAILLTGCAGIGYTPKKSMTVTAGNTSLTTEDVKKGNISITIQGIGAFSPARTAGISYKDVSGPLKSILVKTGDMVKAGQAVAEIDVQDILKDIEDKKMSLQLMKLQQQQIDESLAAASRSIQQAKSNKDTAAVRYSIESTLVNKNTLDSANTAYEQAVSSEKNAGISKQIAEVQYKQAEKQLAELQTKTTQSQLLVPYDGMVVYVDHLSETELVNAGHVLVRIADVKNIVFQLLTGFSGNLQDVKKGVLTVDGEKFDVEIYTPQPGDQLDDTSANDSKAKNKIYLSFTGKTPKINLDKSAQAGLEISKSNTLLIPKVSLHEANGKTTVDVMKNGQIETIEVVKGIEKDDMVEVLSGLEEGAKVVVQ